MSTNTALISKIFSLPLWLMCCIIAFEPGYLPMNDPVWIHVDSYVYDYYKGEKRNQRAILISPLKIMRCGARFRQDGCRSPWVKTLQGSLINTVILP